VGELEQALREQQERGEGMESQLRGELEQYEEMVELFKDRIEVLDRSASEHMYSREEDSRMERAERGVSCQLIPNDLCRERADILDKVRVLIEVGEQQRSELAQYRS
jgi:hypothetical protein